MVIVTSTVRALFALPVYLIPTNCARLILDYDSVLDEVGLQTSAFFGLNTNG